MKKKFRIEVSDIAYEKINELLNINKEYSYLRFASVPFCGSKAKLEVSLDDKIESDDNKITFRDLTILFKEENLKDYEIIFLIFEDGTFKVKGEKNSEAEVSGCGCSSNGCSGGCSSSGGCGGCSGCKSS